MPGSPRTRAAKPALSRESIVAAALDLVDELGTDAVSLRRVAKAVDTAPASLYVYVADRRELMLLAHDLAVAGVELPVEADGDWRVRLELLVERVVDALAAHRDIAAIGLTDLATGSNSLRIIEELLWLLRAGKVADEACAWAVDLFGQYIASSALEKASWGLHDEDRSAGGATARLEAFHAALPVEDYPTIRALAPALSRGGAQVRARWKLRVLVDGILAQL